MKNLLFVFVFLSLLIRVYSQGVGIGSMVFTPDVSAMLEVRSTEKGVLIPRMTIAQRDAISNPANSLLIFNIDTRCFEWWDAASSQWIPMGCACPPPLAPIANAASGITETSFIANWSAVVGVTSYFLDVATNSTFTNFVPGYNNLNVGNVTSYSVTGLACNTQYFYRVRAANACGTSSNSNTITVTTSMCLVITCGAQEWMLVNVNAGVMVPGNQEQNDDNLMEKWCYNNLLSNCDIYGGLYQWAEALQLPYSFNTTAVGLQSWMTCDPCGSNGRQGICPPGYHIPTDLEWSRYEWCVETTINPIGNTPLSSFQNDYGAWRGTNSNQGPGAKLKATNSHTPPWDGTNASGFTALPGGITGGTFTYMGWLAGFWTASETVGSSHFAWYRLLETNENRSHRGYNWKTFGYSVRCIRD